MKAFWHAKSSSATVSNVEALDLWLTWVNLENG